MAGAPDRERSMLVLELALACTLSLAPTAAPSQGGVHRVGPTRAHATIGAAVAAAAPGDLVLVDPGSYPAFTVDGKGLSILPEGVDYRVLEGGSTTPAITVRNVAGPEQVTIVGARIEHAVATDAPAVRIEQNPGAVRMGDVVVVLADDMYATAARAAVEVEDTRTLFLDRVRVRQDLPRVASHFGGSGWDGAVSGLLLANTKAVLKGCRIEGYHAGDTHGGDGLRVEGTTIAWLVDAILYSPQKSLYQAGDGQVGGSAIHAFGTPWNENRVTACGAITMVPGAGTSTAGGYYAINDDAGIVGGGIFTSYRRPDGCASFAFAETSVASHVAPLGTSFEVGLLSVERSRYLCVASLGTRLTPSFYGMAGRALLDVSPQAAFTLSAGTLPASRALRLQVRVPNQPALVGTQLAFQTAIGRPSGPLWALTMPSFVVVTP